MTTFALLGSGLNATTNPDPNTLTTVNPLPTGVTLYQGTPNIAWTSQTKKCLILPPQGLVDSFSERCWLRFVPSGGSAVTYTITLWRFALGGTISTTSRWDQAFSGSSNDYTGFIDDYIEGFDGTPLYPQITSLSSGTLSIYYDNSVAGVI